MYIPYFGTVCVANFCYYKNPVKWIILCCFTVQCLLLYFASADYRKWMPWEKKMVNFYLFPVYLRQVYIVLVLTSTNQKARNRYPEMVMAQTVCGLLHACGNLKEKGNGSFKMLRIVKKNPKIIHWNQNWNFFTLSVTQYIVANGQFLICSYVSLLVKVNGKGRPFLKLFL